MREYSTFTEFWPYYLTEHRQASTRAWHYFGTSCALFVLIFALTSRAWGFIGLAFICGYLFAWLSHAFIERNRPATFTYPLWSLAADFKMLFCFITGRMSRELEKAGIAPTRAR